MILIGRTNKNAYSHGKVVSSVCDDGNRSAIERLVDSPCVLNITLRCQRKLGATHKSVVIGRHTIARHTRQFYFRKRVSKSPANPHSVLARIPEDVPSIVVTLK